MRIPVLICMKGILLSQNITGGDCMASVDGNKANAVM